MSHTFFLASVLTTLSFADVVAQTTFRPLSTDRPDRTESPYSVPKGWVQIESDLVSHGQLEINEQTITGTSVATFNVKYGVTPRFDMQFVFAPWVHVHSEGPGFDDTTDDTGQAGVRAKFNLAGNDTGGAAVALLPFVFVPTRGDAIFDSATWGMVTPVAIAISKRASLSSMLGTVRVNNDEWWMIGSFSLGTKLVGPLAGFLETYVARAGFESDALDDVTVDAGLTFAPTDAWQLDTGVYYGVTDNTEHWRVFVGASARFSLSD
jgi:hypothetical protein